MSIKGIRKIKDNRRGNLDVYESQDFGKNSQLRNCNPFKLIQLEMPKKKQIARFFARLGWKLANQEYDSFLDNEIQMKDIFIPIHGYHKNSFIDPGFKSFSSREYRKDSNTSKVLSRLSNNPNQIVLQNFKPMTKQNFILQYVVGKGGFGKVWKVKEKKSGLIFAMKQMLKIKVIKKKSVSSVMNQKILLEKLQHPFIVNIRHAFQDLQNLFLVMDYVNCGDLRYHLSNRRKFTQIETKFFIACILVALEYMHSNGIIHRDIKPQNLVIDDKGYVKVTDLGISREFRLNNATDTSGTPGYMSPEVICKSNHSYPADYFAVGVIGYEFMLGKRPYVGRNRQQIRQQILAKQMKIEEIPAGWSIEAVDFVNRLIQRKVKNRLGYDGIAEIKSHNWFRGFDWVGLKNKTLKVPFIPLTIEQDYNNYKECISSDTLIEDEQECKLLMKNKQTQELFEGYQFNATTATTTSYSPIPVAPIKSNKVRRFLSRDDYISKKNQSISK